jgi:hypothetical protein
MSVKEWLRECALSIVFGLLFVAALVGQAFAGWHQFNAQQLADGLSSLSLGRYLTSADFAVDVAENWQSEFLQFVLYIWLTVWLLQKGSPESKELDAAGRETLKEQKIGRYAERDSPAWAKTRGWRTAVYSNSLVLAMGSLFVVSWLAQSIAGWAAYNEDRLRQSQDPLPWSTYLLNADFWARTLQNWQSEFLAVGTMVVFSVFLRQRGSPESKPVGEPHASTGIEG